MTEPLLDNRNINQLAFVVKDIESANEAFTRLLGIKKVEPFLTGDSSISKVVCKGAKGMPTDGNSKYMFINTPFIQIELIEPGDSPSTWKQHFETYGEGVHHISFVVNDMEEKMKMLEEMGYPVIQTGNFFNGKGRYAYMDTTSTYKVIITPLSGKLYNKTGPVPLFATGILIMIVGTYMMGGISIESTTLYIIIWTSVRYIGIALCNMPITNAGMSAVPLEIAGYASAMNNWVRQCSTSLSIALFSALLAFQISEYVQKGNSISAAASLAVDDAFLYMLIPLILALLLSILLQKEEKNLLKIEYDLPWKIKTKTVNSFVISLG